MKKVIVHVGYPKTATTSLQVNVFPFLGEHCEYLGKHPYSRTRLSEEWLSLFRAIVSSTDDEFEIEITKKILFVRNIIDCSSSELLIFSNEGFLRLNRVFKDNQNYSYVIFDRLKRIFEGATHNKARLFILVTIRSQATLLPSLFIQYQNNIKLEANERTSFPIFISNCLNRDKYFNIFDYSYLKKILCEIFSKEQVYMFPMEGIMSSSQNKFLDQFSKILGISPQKLMSLNSENIKNSRKELKNNKIRYRTRGPEKTIFLFIRMVLRILKVENFLKQSNLFGIYSLFISSNSFSPSKKQIDQIKVAFNLSNQELESELDGNLKQYDYY